MANPKSTPTPAAAPAVDPSGLNNLMLLSQLFAGKGGIDPVLMSLIQGQATPTPQGPAISPLIMLSLLDKGGKGGIDPTMLLLAGQGGAVDPMFMAVLAKNAQNRPWYTSGWAKIGGVVVLLAVVGASVWYFTR